MTKETKAPPKTDTGQPVETPPNAGAPAKPASTASDVAAFLRKVQSTPGPQRQTGQRGRLIFGMDATASREPTWDTACHIQGEMFEATKAIGGLDVQLVFYRGFGECKSSAWVSDAGHLARLMSSVRCLGGKTQVNRILNHALGETAKGQVGALVFVGDCFEEDIDIVCHTAGELGLRNVPAFMFHEGYDPIAQRAFKEIARLTGGAYAPFNINSAGQLKSLLYAVAVYAAGGRAALMDYGKRQGGDVLRLTQQLRR